MIVCDEQGSNCSSSSSKNLLHRQVIHASYQIHWNRVNNSMATFYSSAVLSTFSFYILFACNPFRKWCLSIFSYSIRSIRKLSTTNKIPTIWRSCGNASWKTFRIDTSSNLRLNFALAKNSTLIASLLNPSFPSTSWSTVLDSSGYLLLLQISSTVVQTLKLLSLQYAGSLS